MDNMGNLVEAIGKNFERFLRWIFPAALFLVLLGMSRPQDFRSLAQIEHPWGLVVGGLVAGSVAYLFQGYVINHFVSFMGQILNWDVGVGLHVKVYKNAPQPRQGFRNLARLFDRHAMNTWDRWSGKLPEDLRNYLNYAWATYHAVLLTGWLTVGFFLAKEENSVFGDAEAWTILTPAGLLLVGGLWTYLYLSRVPATRPQ